ncbi:MAG: hypothetical protein R3C28_22390 [Pirellulaceae bacterium]
MLFADDDQESAEAARKSIVALASVRNLPNAKTPLAASDDFPVQSFHDILQDLGTLCRNRIRIPEFDSEFDKLTLATPYQQHVLDLLGVTAN